MHQFIIRIANQVIEINTLHIYSKARCRFYITDEKPSCNVRMEQKDIDQERRQYESLLGECTLWDGSLEWIALHSKLSEKLVDYGFVLMHGAVIAYDGYSYLFMAPSCTGKTTHILKWLDTLSDSYVVNGDKPFIKFTDECSRPLACGAPWCGKEGLGTNTMVPLKAIICMERADNNSIRKISFAEAFPFVLQQTYRPNDEVKMRKTLQLLESMNGTVEFYKFECNNFKNDCFDIAYNTLVKNNEQESYDQ